MKPIEKALFNYIIELCYENVICKDNLLGFIEEDDSDKAIEKLFQSATDHFVRAVHINGIKEDHENWNDIRLNTSFQEAIKIEIDKWEKVIEERRIIYGIVRPLNTHEMKKTTIDGLPKPLLYN